MSRLARSLACGASATAILLGVGAGAAGAATLTVTTTADSLASDGQCSLREAIIAANSPGTPGDCGTADVLSNTIVLGPDTYKLSIKPTGEDDQTTGDLDVNPTAPPLTIEGAGPGSTQISGAQLGDRIMHVLPGANATIREVTITEGHAPDGAAGEDGVNGIHPKAPTAGSPGFPGGALRNEGILTLERVAVTKSTAGNGGVGGVGETLNKGSEGGAAGAGGGIQNSGKLTLTDVTVSGNVAGEGGKGGEGGEGGDGGPGANGGCCGDGGGLDNAGGEVKILGSTFAGNRAGAGGSGGAGAGGLAVGGEGGSGAGGSSGGAIASTGGSISITNTTISGNSSGVGGDGGPGGSESENIGLAGNGGGAGNGSAGGGLFVSGGSNATLLNVTVDGNQVEGPGTPGTAGFGHTPGKSGAPGQPAFGGGIYARTTPAIGVSNTLLGTNELGNCAGNISDSGHNLSFGMAGCPAGFLIGDPKLRPLADNGGPTQTMALGAGSAAIDQVPSSGCPSDDQRGVPRPSGAACDIGAYEVTPPSVGPASASAITETEAILSASVTPYAGSAVAGFEFGTSQAYGSATAQQAIAGGLQPQPASATLTGLTPGRTYHFRFVASTLDGIAQSADATFTTAAATATKAPELSHLKVNPAKVGRKGAKIGYEDSEAATTSFKVLREGPKPRPGARCAKLSRRTAAQGCAHLIALGGFSHADVAGSNSLRLPRRVARHKLTPGGYELQATPRNAGGAGATVSARFTVG